MSQVVQDSWAWNEISNALSLPQAIDALNDRMRKLQSANGLTESSFRSKARVNTTDATATLIETLTIPPSTSVLCVGYVVARRTGGAAGTAEDGAGYKLEFVAKNDAGTASLIAAATLTVIGESQAAWTVTATASGGTVLVKVTGAANNSISWRWSRRTFSVAT